VTLETIVFSVKGRPLPHTSATLDESAEEAVRNAVFDVAWTGPGIPCAPDDEATITISGELWGTGYVRDVRGAHDENSRTYAVSFVSKTCDATECSVDDLEGLKRDADLGDIAEAFDSYGVGVEIKANTIRKSVHKIRPGETLFQTLETDARAQGVLIYDSPEGKLVLADKPEGRHAGALRRGVNIESASGSLSGATSFSKVKVRGQASIGVSASALRAEAEAKGASRRKRVLIVPFEGEATSERLKKRAKWEARRASGEGVTCTITVPGFRDEAGRLWQRNRLVEVDDDWLGIEQDMVIASAKLSQDGAGGTTTTLSLKDPRALGGDNPRGKSNDAWAAPGSADADYREG
jgi:prophage tail gpP-like protein